MAEIVYENLFDDPTPLPAGAAVDSATIDVNGARTVHLLFGGPGPNLPDVYWNVSFGPLANGGSAATNSGTFQDDSIIAIAVPVFAPSLLLQLNNQSTQDEACWGAIYFIRDVT